MASWKRTAMPAVVAVLALVGCAARPAATVTPVPSPAGAPAASAERTPAPATAPAVEPASARPPLEVGAAGGSDVIATGALDRDGNYSVRSAGPEPRDLVVIPDIEARIPDPWSLLDNEWTTPQLSDTGFLALQLTSGPRGDENAAVGVFDLLDPDADARVFTGNTSEFRVAGDRLWIRTDERAFAVYELPGTEPISITVPADRSIPRGRSVPFYLSDDGGGVLVRRGGADGDPSLLDVTGTERAVPAGEPWLLSTRVELPFGPGGSALRAGPCEETASEGADLCVLDDTGAGTSYDVPGHLVDVAWDPGERTPTWLSTNGVGTITDGSVRMTVRLADWQPVRIAGFWSNVVILASDTRPRVAYAILGADAITELPMPADSVVPLAGDTLLRVFPGEDVPD